MESPDDQGRRLEGYARLSRLLFPRSYLGKIVLLTFVGTHVPLGSIIVYLLVSGSTSSPVIDVVLVALVATLVSTAAAIVGLWFLLTPVRAASTALHTYRRTGTPPSLPTTLDGEAGQLLADVQSTLHDLDDLVGQLATEALHDPLTGAPNRRAFERRLARELERVCHHGEQIALVALDVDGLKVVNDDWGHAAGDACLRHLTAATARHLDGHGWIARWGGDEFIAVVWEGPGTPQAEAILAGVAAELAANPVQLPNGVQVKLAVSGGISRARPGERPQELFTRADAELYRAKRGRSLLPQPESTNT